MRVSASVQPVLVAAPFALTQLDVAQSGAGRGSARRAAVPLDAHCAWPSASRRAWSIALWSVSSTLFCSMACVTSVRSLPSSGVSWPWRAPPDEWARILSDKLLERVLILRVLLLVLLGALARPVFADQAGGAATAALEPRMPFERGTIEISVVGGVSLPVSLFQAKSDHQLAMASLAIGRVMAGGEGKGSLELLVDVTPFFQVRQPDLVRGWSVAPLFVRWNFPAIGNGARIFGEVSGSLLFTTAPVPARTTTFNFLDQAGLGVRFEQSRSRAWLVGYRFQHISNAGRVKPNPGANFNLVYLGLSFLR
jgi:hypothetical protein